MKSLLIISAATLSGTQAGMGFGKCPQVQNAVDLNLSQFQGKWYEIEKDWSFPMSIGAECLTHEYRANADGTADFKYKAWKLFTGYSKGVGGQLINCN